MFVDQPPRFFSGGLDEHSANIRRTPPGKTRGGSPNPPELFTFAEPARLVPAPTVRDLGPDGHERALKQFAYTHDLGHACLMFMKGHQNSLHVPTTMVMRA